MSVHPGWSGVEAKIARARAFKDELDSATTAYFATMPNQISTETNGKVVTVRMAEVGTPPAELALMLGDCLHNLRSALDHMAFQLVWIETGTRPTVGVQFPIGDTVEAYEVNRNKSLKGATAAAVAAVDSLAPYKDGNRRLWQLHKLDIIDKHRTMLVGTMQSPPTAFTLKWLSTWCDSILADPAASERHQWATTIKKRIAQNKIPNFRHVPLKVGDIVDVVEADENGFIAHTVSCGIHLDEPGLFEGDDDGELDTVLTGILDGVAHASGALRACVSL